jgi:hypothetical protein
MGASSGAEEAQGSPADARNSLQQQEEGQGGGGSSSSAGSERGLVLGPVS